MARYDLTEFEWKTIQPLLPNMPRDVPRDFGDTAFYFSSWHPIPVPNRPDFGFR